MYPKSTLHFFCIGLLILHLGLPVQAAGVLIAHMFPDHSLPDRAADGLAEALRKRADFQHVEVAADARLGDERENLRQLQRGDIDIAVVGDLVLDYLVPGFRLVSLPFSHRTPEEALAVYDSELGDEIRVELRNRDIEVLSWHCIGQRMLTANRPIRSLADLQGLVLRLPPAPVWMATWEALGAKPKAVPFPMLYDALRRKVVDAQENPPNFIRANKFYDVQSHLMLSRHLVQRQFILAGRDFYQALDPAGQKALRTAAGEASAQVCREARENQAKDIAWLQKKGMKIVELDLFNAAAVRLPEVAEALDGAAGRRLFKRIQEAGAHVPK